MTGMKNNANKVRGFNLKIAFLVIVFGFISALIIQRRFGYTEFSGAFLISAVLLFLLYKDIMRYKPKYIARYSMLVLMGLIIAGSLLVGRLAEYVFTGFLSGMGIAALKTAVFGIPLPAGAMLVTLLFDFHAAIVFSFIVSLLGGLWHADAVYSIYFFIGSFAGAFSVMRCRKRTALLKGGIYVLGANLFSVTVIYLFRGELFTLDYPLALAFAFFSAVSVMAIVSFVLPAIEYFFKVTTDISLLELLDLDQPLMKSLMVSAPGTYHHSIIVGNLVDSVAESVGANPLLARVASYYHDIGKLKMPEYFIENSITGISKHERLTPHMSSMILMSHVKEGVELAKQYKLPEPIIDIIAEHHGSSLITYFYQKAKGFEHEEAPSEEEYKYPGPKPQSRVSALVMMADAVEASSRVLTDPTPQRIKSLVDKIIDHIYLEGQLDECELTLKDIYEIKKRFTHILTAILHRRVDYPGFDFDEESKHREGLHKQLSKEDKTKPERDREKLAQGSPYIEA
ncbi:MAG: HDIG domain-containing protein [Nitrospirae bacterium]|nr:HDIG domain-containing protein [Nitrospirota bacterium]